LAALRAANQFLGFDSQRGYATLCLGIKSVLKKVRLWRTFFKTDFGFFNAVGDEKSKIGFIMIVFVKLP
jgi:hypothetical protein